MLKILLFTLLAGASRAQNRPPNASIPSSKAALKLALPKARELRLDNGLTVILIENHRLPEIYMRFYVRGAGGFFDPPGLTGLAGATATMLLGGTSTRTAEQIARDVDLLSTEIESNAPDLGSDAIFSLSGLSENFERWFALGVDEFLHPAFSPGEFAKWRQQRVTLMRNRRGDPRFLASERFLSALLPARPSPIPAMDTLESISTEDMKKWHAERYAPQNTVLGIAGDVIPAKILPRLKAAFSSWKRNDSKVPEVRAATAAESRVFLLDRPSAVQTTILFGSSGPARSDSDYELFQLLNELLAFHVRRNLVGHNYAYVAATTMEFRMGGLGGFWQLQTSFRNEVTGPALSEIFSEIRKIRGEADHEEQSAGDRLSTVKHRLVYDYASSLEHPAQLLQHSMDSKLYKLPDDYWEGYISRISAVTEADVRRVAQKYLDPKAMQIVAVGDASRIRSALEQYGKVAMNDTEGRNLP
jgi:predicted Zn-dependent peptidase